MELTGIVNSKTLGIVIKKREDIFTFELLSVSRPFFEDQIGCRTARYVAV